MLKDLMDEVEAIAKRDFGGHFAIFRFTTGWKAGFGTPQLHGGDEEGYQEVWKLRTYPTLEECLRMLIAGRFEFATDYTGGWE